MVIPSRGTPLYCSFALSASDARVNSISAWPVDLPDRSYKIVAFLKSPNSPNNSYKILHLYFVFFEVILNLPPYRHPLRRNQDCPRVILKLLWLIHDHLVRPFTGINTVLFNKLLTITWLQYLKIFSRKFKKCIWYHVPSKDHVPNCHPYCDPINYPWNEQIKNKFTLRGGRSS